VADDPLSRLFVDFRKRSGKTPLYFHTPLDPNFEKADKKRQQETADKLKGDKDLLSARKKWSKLDAKSKKDEEQMQHTLQKIADAQSDTFGIGHVPVEGDPKNVLKGEVARFDEDAGKIYVDLQHKGLNDFARAIEVVLRENAHHWQHELVKALESGKLKSTDPLFNEARLFQANEPEPGAM
jgi:hypothetical protein